jgi:hypothetical protein
MKPQEFHTSISQLLGVRLKPVSGKDLNLATCVEIYTMIFDTMVEVITGAELDVSNEAVNYLAQQYYDGVLINGNQELDPDIFTQRAKLEEISTEELALLLTMLTGTDFAMPVFQEIKRRS